MRKSKRILFILAVLMLIVSLVPADRAWAASGKLTLTIRCGGSGYIDVDAASKLKKSDANVEINKNFVKITVDKSSVSTVGDIIKAGFGVSDADLVFNRITVHPGYSLLPASQWGLDGDEVISHNEDYVLDYGKLVEPVMYTIRFYNANSYDANSGTYTEEIAAPIINYGNSGDYIEINSELISDYATSERTLSFTLDSNKENDYGIYYVYTGNQFDSDNVTFEDVYNYLSQDQINIIRVARAGDAAGANVVVAGDGNDEDAADVDNTIREQDNADNNIDGDDSNDSDRDVVDIQDENVPLASNNTTGNTFWIAGGIVAAILLVLLVVVLFIRKNKKGKA